jgi:hypothetical protein
MAHPDAGAGSLAERVAALEARLAPVHLTFSSLPPLTDAQEAELRDSLAEAMKPGPLPYRVTPPPLSPDEIRQLLRECVTVVKPGETLVIRGRDWTPNQVCEIQQVMDALHEDGRIPFRALAIFGDEIIVAEEPHFMQNVKTEPLDGPVLKVRLTHEPTGVMILARSRAEGMVKLGKALAGRARREHDLQEAERRQQRKAAEEASGAA